jgi:hypothetical protein
MAEFSNTPSFFETFSSAAAQDLMTTQLAAGSPEPSSGIMTVTDGIVPDRVTRDRLSNFDPEIYDLSDDSHLMRLLKVLLGAAGVGGLRKQMAVARMQASTSGMHFLDLDRFYGALFGIQRAQGESYQDVTIDPYTDGTSSEGWNNIHARDASYRSRLVKFAKAIPMGGTYAGLRSMVEALVSADCAIYESWSLVDDYLSGVGQPIGLVYTFQFLSNSFPTWGDMEGNTWNTWGAGSNLTLGRTGQQTRADFIIQPKRALTQADTYELVRVIGTFKPAGTSFIVNSDGVTVHTQSSIRGVAADSEYWEIVNRVTINPTSLSSWTANSTTFAYGEQDPTVAQPRPAFSGYQGEEWAYNGEIKGVVSYSMNPDGSIHKLRDDDAVTFSDGIIQGYPVNNAILPQTQAMSARAISDGVLTAGAYAVSRSTQGKVFS